MPSELNKAQQLRNGESTEFFEVLPEELLTTADRTSAWFYNPLGKGLFIKARMANEAGTFSATINLQTEDADGTVITMWTSAAITANGSTFYMLSPDAGTNSAMTAVVATPIPRKWRILLDYTGTPASDKADTEVHAALI